MAYQPKNLSALAYANGYTRWHYRTSDSGAAVCETGYFNAAASMLRVGDQIDVNTNDSARVQTGNLAVTANINGVVGVEILSYTG